MFKLNTLDVKWNFNASDSTLIHNNGTKVKVISSQDSTLFELQKKVGMLYGKIAITLDVRYSQGNSFEMRTMDFIVTKESANCLKDRIAMDQIYASTGESFLQRSDDGSSFVPFIRVQA